jgi:hypothetical protein
LFVRYFGTAFANVALADPEGMLPMDLLELGIVVWLLLTAWGAVSTLQTTATRGEKIFWMVVLAVPVLGFVGWFIVGPGSKSLPGFERSY